MRNVRVRRDWLVEQLKVNKSKHREQFLAAQDGFRKRLLIELDRRIEDAKNGRKVVQYLNLPEPEDHTSEYETWISMMENNLDEEIELTVQDYTRFVMDNWDWSERVETTNTMYT